MNDDKQAAAAEPEIVPRTYVPRSSWWTDLLNTIRAAISDATWWLRWRTINRYNIVRCDGLSPCYYELDERMLHSMFGLLRDYVEVQCANMNVACDSERNTRWLRIRERLLFWRTFRSRAEGLAHLRSYFEPAAAKKEAIALYTWWMDERPKRPDPMEESGADAAWEKLKAVTGGDPIFSKRYASRDTPEYAEWSRCVNLVAQIEVRNEEEDAAMMKRLIDIRGSLWT